MKLFLLSFLIGLTCYASDPTYTATFHISPTTSIIERKVGASITISTVGGSSLVGASILQLIPRVWVTQTGSSTTSFAFGPPNLNPPYGRFGIAGQSNLFGGSLTVQPMDFVFHTPSIYPKYGSSIQVGTQTYSVRTDVLLTNGVTLYPTPATIKVNPIPLPASQVTGWN